jgi:hypothetical protein
MNLENRLLITNEMKPAFINVEFYDGLESDYLICAKYLQTIPHRRTSIGLMKELLGDRLMFIEDCNDCEKNCDITFYTELNVIYAKDLSSFIASLDLKDGSVRVYFNGDTGFYTLQILDGKDDIIY